jgi:hypothetical protein
MKKKFSGLGLLIALSMVLSIALAAAAVPQDSGRHSATQAEKEFRKSVIGTFKKSIPAGPDSWDLSDENDTLDDLVDTIARPLPVGYDIEWTNSRKKDEAQEKFNQEMNRLENSGKEIPDREIDILTEKIAPRDANLHVVMRANVFNKSLAQAAPQAPVAGGMVYRTEAEYAKNRGWLEGSTYVFLGKSWKTTQRNKMTVFSAAPAKGVSYLEVQTIIVRVSADSERAKQVLRKIDWEALNKLIQAGPSQ